MTERTFLYRNIPNIVSVLGVLPLSILFLEDGFRFLLPLIVYNNIMDDLDGMLAAKLDLRSEFGAALDNVCDAVAHIIIAMAVGTHYGGPCVLLSLIASASILVRVVSRLIPASTAGAGSPTNELMRHLLFALVVAEVFELDPKPFINLAFVFNAISMQVPFPLSFSIRSLARSPVAIGLVNVALVAVVLLPVTALPIAVCFVGPYLYSLLTGTLSWAKHRWKNG
ncbi:MAG: CDP-alcohol phosphatidyltransferase family protein [Deltaproteobacteria bacterium]|nr:CDP-alcohol phosphatidyltransferase family protein [Deltaproteobacteria bacterium]